VLPAPTAASSPTPALPDLAHPRLVILADDLPGPDDLVLAPDGSIYLSDVADGTVRQYTLDGTLRVLDSGNELTG
jgi:hypothetical protein